MLIMFENVIIPLIFHLTIHDIQILFNIQLSDTREKQDNRRKLRKCILHVQQLSITELVFCFSTSSRKSERRKPPDRNHATITFHSFA